MMRALLYGSIVLMAACTSRVVYVDEPAPTVQERQAAQCAAPAFDESDDFFTHNWPRENRSCAPTTPPEAAPRSRQSLRPLAQALREGEFVKAAAIIAELRPRARTFPPHQQLILAKIEGAIALERERYPEAEEASRRAIALGQSLDTIRARRHSAEAHYNLGVSLYYQERIEEAYQELRRYELLVHELGGVLSAEDAYHLGLTAYLSGERAEAYRYFAAADPRLRERAARILEDPEIARAGTRGRDHRVKSAGPW